jgi:hypothetical protein
MVTVSASVSGSRWSDGKPVESHTLADGRTEHTMADGRTYAVPDRAEYRLEYKSSWAGAAPGDTYEVNITIAGLSDQRGFFEVWNHDIGEVRNYAFHKTVRLTSLKSGKQFSGEDVRTAFGGEMLEY